MKPIAVWVKPDGEWSVLHRCERCGTIRANRIAADDNEEALLKLALLPVTKLPVLELYKSQAHVLPPSGKAETRYRHYVFHSVFVTNKKMFLDPLLDL